VRRLVYLSTASVHGQAPLSGTDESSPLSNHQLLPYNNAKVQAERQLLRLRDRGSVELVMLRPGIVFGPRSQWTAGLAHDLLRGTACLVNEGKGICNSIYIDNLVHAIHLAMTSPSADRQAFLVGDQEQITWADFYRPIAESLGLDLAHIPHVAPSEFVAPHWHDRLEAIRTSGSAQAFLSYFPLQWRHAAFLALSALKDLRLPLSPWAIPLSQKPVVTYEMTLLQQCQYKLPFEKAQRILGYRPVVSFAEACRRSIGWLAFAGYPVIPHYEPSSPLTSIPNFNKKQ
jgi:nucleoside-diphosphate-sugar epimerase